MSMRRSAAAVALLAGLVVASAHAAKNTPPPPLDGKWTFSTEDQDQPDLSFADAKRTIFDVGCGGRFILWAVHPRASKTPPKNDSVAVKIKLTIGNGKTTRQLMGQLQAGFGDTRLGEHFPKTTAYVVQTDLGYDHGGAETYGDKWRKDEAALLEFLDSGAPLTISAEGASYTLPPIGVADWRQRFRKVC
jgi:hypothetical protein